MMMIIKQMITITIRQMTIITIKQMIIMTNYDDNNYGDMLAVLLPSLRLRRGGGAPAERAVEGGA